MAEGKIYDAIVVGAGGMGSAAAYHLARNGAEVLVIEQFATGHALGSSHGETRAIRMLYDKEFYTRLMPSAYEEWRRLEAAAGDQLLYVTGSPVMAPEGHPHTVQRAALLEQAGVAYEWWEPDQLMRRFPQFTVPPETRVLWQPDTGFVLASRSVATHLELAVRHGAEIRDRLPVDEIRWEADPLEVAAGGARYRGRAVVCAAGAWSGRLLAELGLPLQVRRQQIAHFRPDDPERYQVGVFPVYVDATDAEVMYGFPLIGIPGVKVARDGLGDLVSPDDCDRTPDEDHLEYLRDFMRRRIPGAAGEVVEAQVCLYTETPDLDFIIDAHPDCPCLLIAAGFSGHGFKFTALVGRLLSEMVLRGEPTADLRPFRVDRFTVG